MADLLYPDNEHREARVYELADDIGTLLNDLSDYADEITSLSEQIDETIKAMYSDIQVDIPSSSYSKFEYEGWAVTLTDSLEPLISIPVATWALQKVAISYLLRAGRIGEAGLYDLIGGLTWVKFGVGAGAVVVTVGLELATDAIAGGIKKSKLQDAIQDAIQPRLDLKKAAIINGLLREKLKTVVDLCTAMKELGYTQEQLDQGQQTIAAQFQDEVDKITDETAKQALDELDKSRGSWTNEDYHD